tara:strand:+ start:602 stop:1870 length:1269 start_codon:yes stop_codon:yes gene_type:complete
MAESAPIDESARIESLDVLRGFALLGILLLNIIGFGFVSAAYTAPALIVDSAADVVAWVLVDLTAEGAMRGLFSILFGAGVVLFLGRDTAGRGWLHYKRSFWLLIFGLFNGYVLLWTGDILVTYAICGFLLFLFRNVGGKQLLITSVILIALLTLYNSALHFGLLYTQALGEEATELYAQGKPVSDELAAMHLGWQEFAVAFYPSDIQIAQELAARGGSYLSAFEWTLVHNTEILLGYLWYMMVPDALVLMMLGMAMFKLGVLQGKLDLSVYRKMAFVGLFSGLMINAYELWSAHASQFDLVASFNSLMPTYHLGRVALAIGWIGLIVLLHRSLNFGWRLAAVGRMALTNYLMHSFICLFIFTGAGFGLIGQMSRWEVYGVVLGIWILQVYLSPWWLARYHYGPAEWAWRGLTYGRLSKFKR